jgi:hypothetical protein
MNGWNTRVLDMRLRPEGYAHVVGLLPIFVLGAVVVLVMAEPETALHLTVLCLGTVFFLALPHWAVLAILVLAMFRLSPARIGPLSTAELLAALLVVPFALQLLRERHLWAFRVPEVRLVLGIAGVMVAAVGWSLAMHPAPPLEALDKPWNELLFFGESLVLLLYFVHFIKTPRHLGYAVVVVLLMILAAASEAVSAGRRRAGTDYFGGFTGNENRLAHFCLWGTALFWCLRYKGPDGWWRPLTLAPLLGLPIVTLMTGSRSGLVQLVVLGALILLEQRQWSPAQRVRACALLVIVALLTLVVAPTAMVDRASSIDVSERSTAGRLHAIEAGITMLAENPVFGVGPGNFSWRYQLLTGAVMTPHNSYVWALVSGGPLLLILYLALFYRTYRSLRTIERTGIGAFTWLATALRFNLVMLLVFSFFATLWTSEVFWLLICLTIVVTRVQRFRTRPLASAAPALVGRL